MTFVAAELFFFALEDKLGVISVFLDSISQASSIVANESSETLLEISDRNTLANRNVTLH